MVVYADFADDKKDFLLLVKEIVNKPNGKEINVCIPRVAKSLGRFFVSLIDKYNIFVVNIAPNYLNRNFKKTRAVRYDAR